MTRFRIGLVALVVFGLAAGVSLAGVALTNSAARELWQLRKPDHYRYVVYWRNTEREGHWRIEMRNGKMAGLRSWDGQPLASRRYYVPASPYVMIDRLFDRIDERTNRKEAAGLLFAQTFPKINRQLATSGLPVLENWARHNICASPPPLVRYDLRWGFPAEAKFHKTSAISCGDELEFADYLEVRIESIEVLP